MKDLFTKQDFEECGVLTYLGDADCEFLANFCNTKLNAKIEKTGTLYRLSNEGGWYAYAMEPEGATHRAYVISVEEIEPKECEHEPRPTLVSESICRHCNVKMIAKAEWEVAE